MKKSKKCQKTGEFQLIFLFLSILTLFCANLLKINFLSNQNLDAAPFSSEESLEEIEKPEKNEAKISANFASDKPKEVAPSFLTFSAPIINVKDMAYNNNKYYNKNAIMHHAAYTCFYYAHDTGAFKNLKSLKEGQIFILGGQKYEVKKISYLTYAETQKSMENIVTANYSGAQYDISMMTCAGQRNYQSRTGLTNSHRLIIYADQV